MVCVAVAMRPVAAIHYCSNLFVLNIVKLCMSAFDVLSDELYEAKSSGVEKCHFSSVRVSYRLNCVAPCGFRRNFRRCVRFGQHVQCIVCMFYNCLRHYKIHTHATRFLYIRPSFGGLLQIWSDHKKNRYGKLWSGFLTGRVPFLSTNQQCQSTDRNNVSLR